MADDGSLWAVSRSGDLLHAVGDTADGANSTPFTRWSTNVADVRAVRGLGDVSMIATASEVLRVERGVITSRAAVPGVRQIEIVRVDEASHVVAAGSVGLTLLRADDLGGAQITTVPGGVNAL